MNISSVTYYLEGWAFYNTESAQYYDFGNPEIHEVVNPVTKLHGCHWPNMNHLDVIDLASAKGMKGIRPTHSKSKTWCSDRFPIFEGYEWSGENESFRDALTDRDDYQGYMLQLWDIYGFTISHFIAVPIKVHYAKLNQYNVDSITGMETWDGIQGVVMDVEAMHNSDQVIKLSYMI